MGFSSSVAPNHDCLVEQFGAPLKMPIPRLHADRLNQNLWGGAYVLKFPGDRWAARRKNMCPVLLPLGLQAGKLSPKVSDLPKVSQLAPEP